jgi:hypothetical protein
MFKQILTLMLSAALVFAGFVSQASAAVIGTQQALSVESRAASIDQIQGALARADMQQAMLQLGADPAQVQQRVAALSDAELVQLQGQLEQAPAGGVIVALGVVFLVLLILHLTGTLSVFRR